MSTVDVSRQESRGLVSRVATHVVRYHPIKLSFYIIGLICLFFTGFEVSETQWVKHDELIRSSDYIKAKHHVELLQDELREQNIQYRKVKGWFSCNPECEGLQLSMNDLRVQLAEVSEVEATIKKKAMSHLGLFSSFSIKNLRSLFFDKFNSGKDAAMNRSLWDFIFIRMYRDEEFLSYIARVIFNFLFNFMLGMLMAFFTFCWSLVGFIKSYSPGYIEGIIFFVLAATTAGTFLISWIAIFSASTAGTVYVIGKAVVKNAAIEDQQRRQHVKYD